MKRLFFILVILLATITASSVNPNKLIDVKNWPDGTVVFVKPARMTTTDESVAYKPMEYDIALNTMTDTVAITCSIFTRQTLNIDSVAISTVGKYTVEQLYVEPSGSGKWLNRVRISIPRLAFETMISQISPPVINFSGAAFRHTLKKWQECQQTSSLALIIIDQNKKR